MITPLSSIIRKKARMIRTVVESSVLFISIVKWLFLASVAGVDVGLSTTVFLKAPELGCGCIALSILVRTASGGSVHE
jgi:hypothetical protein